MDTTGVGTVWEEDNLIDDITTGHWQLCTLNPESCFIRNL